jgi:hypothetical protein
VPKNYRNVTGVAASDKAAGPAQFETTLERDFLAIPAFLPEVEHFEVPLRISVNVAAAHEMVLRG